MRHPGDRLRIVVLGYTVRGPLAGLTWHHLQYLMSARDLGHDVYFLEDSGDYASCYDPTRHTLDVSQIAILQKPETRALADAHTVFFTFGESVGQPDCRTPDDGHPWRPTRQPVALSAWPGTPGPGHGCFTTVMTWEGEERREYGGVVFGMKSESFGPYFDLPMRHSARFELAVGSPPAPVDRLRGLGWRTRDPLAITCDPWAYQDFIRASKAEFSVANHGYVVAASGWFSERSAAYLASGRPVVTQDTGFSRHLPAGEGLFAFTDPEEALAVIREVEADYPRHCRAARRVAEDHFDGRRVLGKLIEQAFVPTAASPPTGP